MLAKASEIDESSPSKPSRRLRREPKVSRRTLAHTPATSLSASLSWIGLAPRQQTRTFLNYLSKQARLRALEQEANQAPADPVKQQKFIQELAKDYPEAVKIRVELNMHARNEAVTREYIKALARLNDFNGSPLGTLSASLSTPTVEQTRAAMAAGVPNAIPGFDPATAPAGAPFTGSALALGSSGGGLNPSQPLHVRMVEPSTRQQIWKTFRALGIAFLIISAVGATFDDRGGLSSKLMMGTNLHIAENSDKKFSDVMGVDEAKQELQEIVMFLQDPSRFTRLGGKLPKGLLLMGPPGTGKTLLARAIAGEAGVPFFYSSGSEFEEMYVGVGARRIRDLFDAAKKRAPCIIFIDEIDAIGGSRHMRDQHVMKMTLNQLLVELDGFEQNKGVIVIGATNFAQSLDDALLRPGRFDKHVTVPLPDIRGRQQILEMYLRKVAIDRDVNPEILARGTPGMSGAELSNVINQAALKASIDGLRAVNMRTLEWARDKISMGPERRSAVIPKDVAVCTAYHEGGHALVALKTAGADPLYKATIMPRGPALGMVTQLAEGDRLSMSKKEALARMDVCMGGRIAEEIFFGADNVTSGASSDFAQATRLARLMVTKWGMGENAGIVTYSERDMAAGTRAKIDEEVKSILTASYARAKHILESHKDDLEVIAKALMEHETLTGAEIKQLLRGERLDKPKLTVPAIYAPRSEPRLPPGMLPDRGAGLRSEERRRTGG